MTYDLVVLSPTLDDVATLVDGMMAAGEDLRVHALDDGALLQVRDEHGDRVLFTVENLQVVAIPGEVERVLGPVGDGPVPVPVTWVEVHAATDTRAVELAHVFATEVVRLAGGAVWSTRSQRAMGR